MHMIYAVGCNVVIEHLQSRKQEFLVGHNNNISCIAVSKTGKYIASGQITYMGFKVKNLFKFNNAVVMALNYLLVSI